MSSLSSVARRALRARPAFPAGRTLWAALAIATAPAVAWAQGETSTAPVRLTPLVNKASAAYVHDGIADTTYAGAIVSVARQAALSLTGTAAASLTPGQRRTFAHRLTNRGTTADVARLSAAVDLGWPLTLYRDVDGDGRLSAGDVPAGAEIDLPVGASVTLIAVVTVPELAAIGAVGTVAITATSQNDARASVLAADRVTVIAVPAPDLVLTKLVDRATGTTGDTLRYRIAFSNEGTADARDVVLTDTIPRGLRALPGALALDGAPRTDDVDGDSASVVTLPDGRSLVRVALGTLAPGAGGTLTLAAVVTREATNGQLANLATIAFGDSARTFAVSAATTAMTSISVAALGLSEQLVGSAVVTVGAQVRLRLSYANTSGITARNVVLVDTLPASFTFESSEGVTASAASGTGAARVPQVVTWPLGTLAAGATGTRELLVRVAFRAGDGDVTDQAAITADNAATQLARASASVALFMPRDLAITKSAAVLEAAIGDAVPYVVRVRNRGLATLRGIVVHDRLPAGVRYAPASLSGADSATVDGQALTIYVGTPLAPAATATVRYAAVVATPAPGAPLQNLATAVAEGGLVHADTAIAVVTQRRQLAMRERTLIGKVWLDRNADGTQQEGEEGVAGVQVWDTNGDFAVTDKEGRFSFRNVATGTHALRLDPAGIPRRFVLPTRADEVVTVQADGWSLPSVSIRLVPRAGAPATECACDTSSVTAAARGAATLASAKAPAPAGAIEPATARPTVAPLLDAAHRALEARRALIEGTGVRVVAPADGAVIAGPRFFTGVRGAPGALVGLFDGDSLLRSAALRGDGSQDFVNVELEPGPHRLRVVTLDSAATPRGDSIALHVSGAPTAFVVPAAAPVLRRDALQPVVVRVQVLDRWKVPVADRPMITVSATGAVIAAGDDDPGSVGLQLRADAAGWVSVPLRAGFQVGDGVVRLEAADARGSLPVRMFASVRPLVVTGAGQVGLGNAAGTFGAVLVQGAVTENTSVALSYDSRRATAGDDAFQRTFDPRGDEQLPTVGDNSTSRSVAPTTKAVSARLEHGMDWLAAGDVQTLGFGREGELGAYRRSVTGVSGRVGTGALTWHGFGSMTRESVQRAQLRADGSTGPYVIGGGIRAGTEAVAIEVRARDNAARIVTRQPLGRLTDYQVDYLTGTILLRLPVPATDGYGNPVYVVVVAERTSGGTPHFVGGLRLDADAARALRLDGRGLDSLTIGLSGIRDDAAGASLSPLATAASRDLVSADVRLRRGGLALDASMLRSLSPDSSGTATSASGRWATTGDRLALEARWMSVGQGMGGTDPRLAAALTEAAIAASVKLGAASTLRLQRAESRFSQFGITRASTSLVAEELVGGHRTRQDVTLLGESGAIGGATSAVTARVGTAITDRLESWVDGTRSLAEPLAGRAAGRPNQLGAGLTFLLPAGLKLEASHRVMRTPGDSVSYGVTSAQLRAEGVLGGQVWTGVERSTAGLHDEVRAGHSALLGWNQQVPLGAGWQLTSMYERRFGLSRASVADPERALPFVQAERDRWSAAAGLGWMPGGDRARLTLNAELQDGQGSRSSRLQLAGDAALNAGLALIALNDWAGRTDALQGQVAESRQDRSLLGLAMRPVTTNRLNVLTKLEWRRTITPAGTAALLTTAGRDLRLIGSSDVVWAPVRGTELSVRYALRSTTSDIAGDSARRLHVADHFAGGRVDRQLAGALHLRADGRLLMERESGTALWNLAPSAFYDVQGRLQLEAGYRFGGLRDPDFAAVGGAGAFATVGFRFTEGSLATPAAFWRERIARDR